MIPAGYLRLPERYGVKLWAVLAKGAAHKYIRRVPTGKTTKTGKPRYRYYYHAAHGGGVGAHEHMVEGAAFQHDGGHWHIKKTDGDKLHIEHDETGKSQTVTRAELAKMLETAHAKDIADYRAKAAARVKEAKESGASAKQVAALEEHARRAGVRAEEKPPSRPEPKGRAPVNLTWTNSDKNGHPAEVGDIYLTDRGSDAGHYVVVTSKERSFYTSASANEDNGRFDGATWTHTANVRPATNAEKDHYDKVRAEAEAPRAVHAAATAKLRASVDDARRMMTRAESDAFPSSVPTLATASAKEYGAILGVRIGVKDGQVYLIQQTGFGDDAGWSVFHAPEGSKGGDAALAVADHIREVKAAADKVTSAPSVRRLIPSPNAAEMKLDAKAAARLAEPAKPPKAPATASAPQTERGAKAAKMGLQLYPVGGESIAVFGNTYEHKDKIRAAGGRWDGSNKRWLIQRADLDRLFKGSSLSPLTAAFEELTR